MSDQEPVYGVMGPGHPSIPPLRLNIGGRIYDEVIIETEHGVVEVYKLIKDFNELKAKVDALCTFSCIHTQSLVFSDRQNNFEELTKDKIVFGRVGAFMADRCPDWNMFVIVGYNKEANQLTVVYPRIFYQFPTSVTKEFINKYGDSSDLFDFYDYFVRNGDDHLLKKEYLVFGQDRSMESFQPVSDCTCSYEFCKCGVVKYNNELYKKTFESRGQIATFKTHTIDLNKKQLLGCVSLKDLEFQDRPFDKN